MGKVIPLHTSPMKCDRLPIVNGYRQIPKDLISKLFEALRGGEGPDAFVIKQYFPKNAGGGSRMLMYGCIPPTMDTSRRPIRESLDNLEAEIDLQAPEAEARINGRISRIYEFRHHEKNMVFVRSDKGLIACGWFDRANSSQKGKKMACYLLYAFGALNMRIDHVLYTAIYSYLPYESEAFSSPEVDKVEGILIEFFGENITARRN